MAVVLAICSLNAQNNLEITDVGNITRERWRDSVLRIDKNQVPHCFDGKAEVVKLVKTTNN